jgi:hypothetical protein
MTAELIRSCPGDAGGKGVDILESRSAQSCHSVLGPPAAGFDRECSRGTALRPAARPLRQSRLWPAPGPDVGLRRVWRLVFQKPHTLPLAR